MLTGHYAIVDDIPMTAPHTGCWILSAERFRVNRGGSIRESLLFKYGNVFGAVWKVAAFFLCAGFQSSRVIYLSAERKTQSCAGDYAEEPLKTFSQRPTLSDAELAITSQMEICVSLPATLFRYLHTNRKREARIPGSGSSRELGAGIIGADDKHRPLFQAFK